MHYGRWCSTAPPADRVSLTRHVCPPINAVSPRLHWSCARNHSEPGPGQLQSTSTFLQKKETGILFFFGQTPLGPRTNISRLYFLKNSVSFAETTLTLQQDFQPICSLTIRVCFPAMCVCVEFSLQVCERQSLAVALHCWTAIPDINHPQPTLLKPERGKDFLSNPPPP